MAWNTFFRLSIMIYKLKYTVLLPFSLFSYHHAMVESRRSERVKILIEKKVEGRIF